MKAGLMAKPLIVSAPFGNYVQPSGATATLGTFTAKRRGGRVIQILKTVRYYRRIRGWVNKIGLRNPGIDWLAAKITAGKIDASDKLVSIHGFDDGEWYELLEKVERIAQSGGEKLPKVLGVELNMSCPNVGHINWPVDLFERAVKLDRENIGVVVKLPPVNYEGMVEQAVRAGVKCFHCTNTLPNVAGGISGKPLKPVSLQCIRKLREQDQYQNLFVIGGGGITTEGDIDEYADAGANVFAVGTKVMNPIYLLSDRGVRELIEKAKKISRKA
ncbi:hypothetical protein [Poriferisphaera sp. WC338]|uniref:hypothetical protein n=1 Tax=Poriferisphaera sp. WC338 TaxID=3425129 RepID=UPI003D81B672